MWIVRVLDKDGLTVQVEKIKDMQKAMRRAYELGAIYGSKNVDIYKIGR